MIGILKIREVIKREYERLRERNLEAYFNREVEKEYERQWQEILKKGKTLKSLKHKDVGVYVFGLKVFAKANQLFGTWLRIFP
jgi:hypothetical protein